MEDEKITTSDREKENQSKAKQEYFMLLKYPVITICVVLGIVVITKYAGIEFGKVVKISSAGIEFANEQTNSAVIDINDSISKLRAEVAFLMEQTGKKSEFGLRSDAPTPEWKESETDVLSRTEIVSNSIARLSLAAPSETSLKGKVGYIWLGEFKENAWQTESVLRDLENKLENIKKSPAEIKSQLYCLDKNMKLRTQPSGESETIGIIPEKTNILLESIHNDSKSNQYWAKVKIEP